jgi:uncharacterized membrane protein
MTLAWRTYVAVLAGALLWCGAIVLTPVLAGLPDPFAGVGASLYGVFSPVCHQIEGRSLTVLGIPLAVCTRCTAVYFGFLAGVALYPFLRSVGRPAYPPRWLVALAVLPMLIDVALGWTGIHAASGTTRLLTGGFFGALIPFIILPALSEAVHELVASYRSPLHHPQKGLRDA